MHLVSFSALYSVSPNLLPLPKFLILSCLPLLFPYTCFSEKQSFCKKTSLSVCCFSRLLLSSLLLEVHFIIAPLFFKSVAFKSLGCCPDSFFLQKSHRPLFFLKERFRDKQTKILRSHTQFMPFCYFLRSEY